VLKTQFDTLKTSKTILQCLTQNFIPKNTTYMVIVSKKRINEYALTKHEATEALNEWFIKTKASDWSNLADVKNTFNSVDYVGNDNYVFNIKGNQYRLIARIIFPVRTVFIRLICTHAEYDKVDASSA